ncbi:MAG: hypothetical protein ACREXT_01320 [Gammaproteobacteria bacterium]
MVQEDAAEEQRRSELAAAYAGLESARRELRLHLDGLKSRTGGLEFPPEQARAIGRDMQQGYGLLSNAPLLGAFNSVEDVERERMRIAAMRVKLGEVDKLIDEAGK